MGSPNSYKQLVLAFVFYYYSKNASTTVNVSTGVSYEHNAPTCYRFTNDFINPVFWRNVYMGVMLAFYSTTSELGRLYFDFCILFGSVMLQSMFQLFK